jgi:hypothetical protein
MLNTNVDYALVGHNFITFLLSLGLIERGKKVLILDDDRFNYGEFFTNSLTALDVQFLKAWGDEGQLLPLKNLDDYIIPENLTFYVGKKQVILGDKPLNNFRELCRKFPHLFYNESFDAHLFSWEQGQQDFNGQYYEFCQKMTNVFFLDQKNRKVAFAIEQSMTPDLKTRFQSFFNHFNDSEFEKDTAKSEFKSLIFMTRGFFQNRLSPTGSRAELMHLFFSLISPYYKLDHERLIADLKKEHLEKGGEFKKLNLSDLKFQKGLVKSFELDSFEGVIKPQKMAFIGGYPVDLPIKLKTNSSSYNCLNVTLEFTSAVPELLKDKKCLFTSPLKMGTDRPFWEVSFKSHSAVFNVIMAKREGSKVEFIEDRVVSLLLGDLKYLYPEFEFKIKSQSMKYTLDVFIQERDYEAHKKSETSLKYKIVDVLEDTAPVFFSKLKNVLYFGPYNENALGTFSSLVEMRKWKKTI